MFQIPGLSGAFYCKRRRVVQALLRFRAPLVLNFMDSRPVAQLVRALP